MTRLCGALLDNLAPAKRSEAYRGLSSRIFNCSRAAQVMCCLALCLVIGGGAARATLITVDDPTFGPNSLVLDTNTDLEWLNLRFSLGLSGRQVLAQTGPAGRFAGFQYATRDQFVTLFTEVFGTSHLANSTGSLDFNATKNFANLFGPTDGTQQLPTIAGLFDVFMSQGLGRMWAGMRPIGAPARHAALYGFKDTIEDIRIGC
jgi:hypothetical protein